MLKDEKTTLAVTPAGGADTPAIRAWIEGEVRKQGCTDLEWVEWVDQYGIPRGRLLGRQKAKEGA